MLVVDAIIPPNIFNPRSVESTDAEPRDTDKQLYLLTDGAKGWTRSRGLPGFQQEDSLLFPVSSSTQDASK